MTIFYKKHGNGVGGILKYTLYGNDLNELNEWKEDFVDRYKQGYCGKCSDPEKLKPEEVRKTDFRSTGFTPDWDVYEMTAERWTSCD